MVAGASRSWFEHCRPTSSGGPATAHPFNATLDRTRGSGRTPLSLSWLTPTERAVVNERAEVISESQWERRVRKPRAEMRVGDIHVGPDRIGSDQYILTLSGARLRTACLRIAGRISQRDWKSSPRRGKNGNS